MDVTPVARACRKLDLLMAGEPWDIYDLMSDPEVDSRV